MWHKSLYFTVSYFARFNEKCVLKNHHNSQFLCKCWWSDPSLICEQLTPHLYTSTVRNNINTMSFTYILFHDYIERLHVVIAVYFVVYFCTSAWYIAKCLRTHECTMDMRNRIIHTFILLFLSTENRYLTSLLEPEYIPFQHVKYCENVSIYHMAFLTEVLKR
jgi:hypothetical protein